MDFQSGAVLQYCFLQMTYAEGLVFCNSILNSSVEAGSCRLLNPVPLERKRAIQLKLKDNNLISAFMNPIMLQIEGQPHRCLPGR